MSRTEASRGVVDEQRVADERKPATDDDVIELEPDEDELDDERWAEQPETD